MKSLDRLLRHILMENSSLPTTGGLETVVMQLSQMTQQSAWDAV